MYFNVTNGNVMNQDCHSKLRNQLKVCYWTLVLSVYMNAIDDNDDE